jgi:hypothetical protein
MPDQSIYALKVVDWGNEVLSSLRSGEGRFGWSYVETANLAELKQRVDRDGWDTLSAEEKDCYQPFLLELCPGDWVVYINTPSWGRCAAAQVTKPYFWRWEDDDFNHRFGVDPRSVFEFDRNDAAVHPALSARLKLQGRKWRISTKHEFEQLVEAARSGRTGTPATSDDNVRFLSREIRPLLLQITSRIHHTHPNYALERLFARIFEKIPGVIDVKLQGGARDHGADIIVTIEQGHPLTGNVEQSTCVVQVKAFEGEHGDTQAVNDLRRAFEHYPDASAGLIVSTAEGSSETFDEELEHLRRDTGKRASLLIGPDVALFAMRYASDLLGSSTLDAES